MHWKSRSFLTLALGTKLLIFYCPVWKIMKYILYIFSVALIKVSIFKTYNLNQMHTWFNSFISDGDNVKTWGFRAWNRMYKGTQRHIIGSITAKTQNLQSRFGPLAGVLFGLQGRFSQSIFAYFYVNLFITIWNELIISLKLSI